MKLKCLVWGILKPSILHYISVVAFLIFFPQYLKIKNPWQHRLLRYLLSAKISLNICKCFILKQRLCLHIFKLSLSRDLLTCIYQCELMEYVFSKLYRSLLIWYMGGCFFSCFKSCPVDCVPLKQSFEYWFILSFQHSITCIPTACKNLLKNIENCVSRACVHNIHWMI